MSTDCIQPQDLQRVLALPAHDSQRQHLATCLHCRAMAHAYAEFLDADGVRPRFDLDAADAELAQRLAGLIEGPKVVKAPRRIVGRSWYAVAAVLLLCAGIFVARDAILQHDARLPVGGGVVRGEGEDATKLAWQQDDDGWCLTWHTDTPGAPVIVFFDENLEELARRALDDPGATLAASAVKAPDKAEYLQLVFEAEGDVVARSAMIAAQPVEP